MSYLTVVQHSLAWDEENFGAAAVDAIPYLGDDTVPDYQGLSTRFAVWIGRCIATYVKQSNKARQQFCCTG